MNKVTFSSLMTFAFLFVTSVYGQLINEVGEYAQCYEPISTGRLCSVFPFRTTLSEMNETLGMNYMKGWISKFQCPAYSEEKHLTGGAVFLCYISLGLCEDQKWAIPQEASAKGLLEMINTQVLKDLSRGDPKKPALCKQTCNEIVNLITACDPFFQNGVSSNQRLCSALPDNNCIDGSNVNLDDINKEAEDDSGAAYKHIAATACFMALFISLFFMVIMS